MDFCVNLFADFIRPGCGQPGRGKGMSVETKAFGVTKDGRKASLYSISNGGITAEVSDYGAALVNLFVPDAAGNKKDVLLGFDDVSGYEENPCFFGAVIGPSANRIAGAKLPIDGTEYSLPVNDGANNLHTDHEHGTNKRFWSVKTGENSVTFSLELADMDLYLPGNRRITVTYTVTDTAALQLHYSVTTDKKTFLNFTNHAYFNLNGQGGAKIYDTKLRLFCSRYTPVVKGAIPTGEIAEVKGTPLDFTGEKTIGRDIDADFEQLKLVGGYDHNFVIDGWTPESGAACRMNKTASVYDPESGRRMEVFTSLPGVQFYAGNFIAGMMKGGRPAMPRDGFALETQYYPDSIHHADFPQAVFSPDRPYESVTEYKFSWQ